MCDEAIINHGFYKIFGLNLHFMTQDNTMTKLEFNHEVPLWIMPRLSLHCKGIFVANLDFSKARVGLFHRHHL